MSKLNTKNFLISLLVSVSLASFLYLLFLQLPYISKFRLLLSVVFLGGMFYPISKSISLIWVDCVDDLKGIVLLASFVGLFVVSVFFYYPNKSYLFYGQHQLEVVFDGDRTGNTQIDITALYTDLKIESYSQFQTSAEEWERNGNIFSTNSSEPTRIIWKGWTGSKVTIKFRKTPDAGIVRLIWDGVPQSVDLHSNEQESFKIVHEFKPPLLGKISLWFLSTIIVSYFLSLLKWLEGNCNFFELVPTILDSKQTGQKNIINFAVILFILITVLNVFLPINPNRLIRDRDDGAFLYIGQQVLNGQIPYLHLWDHKGPLIFYINALGLFLAHQNEWGVWFLQILWLFLVALFSYNILSQVTGKVPALVSICVMFLLVEKPLYGGNYTEEYALLPLLLCWFGFQKFLLKNNMKWLLLVGFSTGLALLLRPNLISGQIGVTLVILFLTWKNKNIKYLFALFLGLIFTLAPVILYFYIKNALYDMISAMFLYNQSYSGRISFQLIENIYYGLDSYKKFLLIPIPSLMFYFVYILTSSDREKKYHYLFSAIILGFFAETWLSNLSIYQFKHYYILWAAYFSIFSSFFFAWLIGLVNKIIRNYIPEMVSILYSIILLFSLVYFLYSSNVFNSRLDLFSAKENSTKTLLTEIEPYAKCCSHLLVWGAEPYINFALQKESPSRYFYQYPLFNDNYATSMMIDDFFNGVSVTRPLIIDASVNDPFTYPLSQNPSTLFTKQTTQRLQPILNYIANEYYVINEMSNGWLIYMPKTQD